MTKSMKIGDYEIEEYLGSWYDKFAEPGFMKEDPNAFVKVELGVNSIISVGEILRQSNDFEVTDDVKVELQSFDFYKVSLVSSFSHGNKLKFSSAQIGTNLVSNSSETKPYVYSISPVTVDEKVQITKGFIINPQIQLAEAVNVSGGSFTFEKKYIKLHPQIRGYYAAGQDARWEYLTTEGIDDIIGSQLVELIIKQPINTRSTWRALPDGNLRWVNFIEKFRRFIAKDKLPLVESQFKTFAVPREEIN
jgi:hypothetical protein